VKGLILANAAGVCQSSGVSADRASERAVQPGDWDFWFPIGFITESWNHRMVWVGKDLKDHLVPTALATGRDTFHQTRLLKAPAYPALNTTREGAATASLGKLCQGLTTLRVKKFFLLSNLNLPSFSLKSLPLVLLLHAFVKSHYPAFL